MQLVDAIRLAFQELKTPEQQLNLHGRLFEELIQAQQERVVEPI